jgi:hypothetical protein
MRRWHKLKPIRKPRKKKQPTRASEVVRVCDACGDDLERTNQRTLKSAVCAAGEGITVGIFRVDNEDLPHFFCSEFCRNVFVSALGTDRISKLW